MPNKNSVSKPVKKGKPVYFEACKAPELRESRSAHPKPTLIFLMNGAMSLFQADVTTYKKVDGAAVENGPHSGYDNLRDHHFVVWAEGDVALSVDRANLRELNMPQRNSAIPNEAARYVEVELSEDGDIYLRSIPQGVKRSQILPLIRAIGTSKTLKKGQELVRGFKIVNIDDEKIQISWPKPQGIGASTQAPTFATA